MAISSNIRNILLVTSVAVLFLAVGLFLGSVILKDDAPEQLVVSDNSGSATDDQPGSGGDSASNGTGGQTPSGQSDDGSDTDGMQGQDQAINNFNQCVAAGNPVMESYPRQCQANGQTFTENIGNEMEKSDLIRLDSPRPNAAISSPLTVEGEARGNWYFEGDFPVILTDWDGLIIATGIAQAQGEWMTEDFVPFRAMLEFEKPAYLDNGSLILQKDNPSGLPQHDDALEIPITFE